MDFKLLFSGGKDIPADVRMIYGGLIKRHQKLKNGWSAVLLRNNMAYLYKTMHSLFLSAASNAYSRRQTASLCWSKKTAKSGFTADGIQTAAFPQVPNCIGTDGIRLTTVKAFPFLRQTASASAAGLRQPAFCQRLLLYVRAVCGRRRQGRHIWRRRQETPVYQRYGGQNVKNGWFIAEDGLYDNLGNSYIGTVNGHTLDWWFCLQSECLCPSAGKLMKGFFPPGRASFYYPYLFHKFYGIKFV